MFDILDYMSNKYDKEYGDVTNKTWMGGIMNIDEVRDWLLKNRVNDDGNLDLSNLDFSDFDGDVYISEMIVKGNLYQYDQDAGGDIIQSFNDAQGKLVQTHCSGEICVDQRGTFTEGDLYTGGAYVKGNYLFKDDTIKGTAAKIVEHDRSD